MADDRADRTDNSRKDRGGRSGRPSGKSYRRDGGRDDRKGGYRPRRDGERSGYRSDRRSDDRGDRPHGRNEGRSGGDRPYRNRDEGRRSYERRDRGSGDRPRYQKGGRSGSGDRGSYRPGRSEEGGRRDLHRSDDRRGYRGDRSGYRSDRGSDRRNEDRRDRDDRRGSGYRSDRRSEDRGRRYEGRGERRPRDDTRQDQRADRVTIPSDPQRILFKGIDCEVNGRSDLAMVLYLHGAAKMSGGCEENAEKMLRGMSPEQRQELRDAIAGQCSRDALIEFDYVRLDLDPSADRSLIDSAAAEGDPLAIYCLIRRDEVGGDDPAIDRFAKAADSRPEMVSKGLDRLKRRKDSEKAARLLKGIEKREQERASINQTFARAMKNDAKALARLEDMSGEFPEAGFLAGYIESDDPEQYLRDGMDGNRDLIVAVSANLALDSGFGRYLRAMKAKSDGEEWIPQMIAAAKAGSEEAERELGSVKGRGDVSRAMAEIALQKGDVDSLVRMYDGEDAQWLDAWCAGDADRMIDVGSRMKEEERLDWLKRCYRNGAEECRDAIVAMASDESNWSKRLVYALHDVGADMEAAKLYFAIGDEARLPSPKWLAKVCEDPEVKEYVRSEYEKRDDLAGFEDIFADDGYQKKRSGKGGNGHGKGSSGKGRGRGRNDRGRRNRL